MTISLGNCKGIWLGYYMVATNWGRNSNVIESLIAARERLTCTGLKDILVYYKMTPSLECFVVEMYLLWANKCFSDEN